MTEHVVGVNGIVQIDPNEVLGIVRDEGVVTGASVLLWPGRWRIALRESSGGGGSGGPVAWADITNKPTSFVVNVKDYGAKGDGDTDDTAAINAALATSANVTFPAGTYRVAESMPGAFALLNGGKRRQLTGAGAGATIIKLDAGGEGLLLDGTGATISGFTFDGGFNPAAATANLGSCVQGNTGTTVRDCHVLNARGSCLVGVGSSIVFTNNRLEKFGDHAVYVAGDLAKASPFAVISETSSVVIAGNVITDDPSYHNGMGGATRGAVKLRNNVKDVTVSDNVITGDMCVLIDGDTRAAAAVPRGIVVKGNILTASYSGVQINTAIEATAGDTGIRVRDVVVSGNVINAPLSPGVGVNLSRSRATISGNLITAMTGVSNFETGDVGASTIIGNTFRGRDGIYKAGTGSIISGNMFDGLTNGVHLNYHHTLQGNTFAGCTTGINLVTVSHASNVMVVRENTITGCTTGMSVGQYARSFAILGNVFAANTITATVVDGSTFNALTVDGNRVLSGPAFPVEGSTGNVPIAPVAPVQSVSALPTATANLRGRMVRVVGAPGTADQAYICRKTASDTYEWAAVL